MRKIFLALSITLVLSLALGAGLAFAANTAAPGDTLFKLDRGLEALQKGLVRSELQPLAAQDDPQLLDDPVEDPEIEPEDPKDGAYCREGGKDNKNHPTGEKLAGEFFNEADFDKGYAEIMGWFCGSNPEGYGHFGFGEIKLAYRIRGALLAKNPGMVVGDIFAMRVSGMGWGNILKDLGLSMKDVKPPKPAKPPKLENGTSGNNGQGNAYGQDKEKGNNGQGKANGHDKNKGNKGKKP